MDFSVDKLPVCEIRRLKREETQHLLGDTIQIGESEWQSPSRLPGWTRAHVAAHLARNADGYRRLVEGVVAGVPTPMYDERTRRDDIERGSEQTGLQLQIDLDTSAQRLAAAFDKVPDDAWDEAVFCAGRERPLRLLPLIRLNEIVMHRVDFGLGYSLQDAPGEVVEWLLRWCLVRTTERAIDSFRVRCPDGGAATVGEHPHRTVTGTSAALLGWLTGRGDPAGVTGADNISLPRF